MNCLLYPSCIYFTSVNFHNYYSDFITSTILILLLSKEQSRLREEDTLISCHATVNGKVVM